MQLVLPTLSTATVQPSTPCSIEDEKPWVSLLGGTHHFLDFHSFRFLCTLKLNLKMYDFIGYLPCPHSESWRDYFLSRSLWVYFYYLSRRFQFPLAGTSLCSYTCWLSGFLRASLFLICLLFLAFSLCPSTMSTEYLEYSLGLFTLVGPELWPLFPQHHKAAKIFVYPSCCFMFVFLPSNPV